MIVESPDASARLAAADAFVAAEPVDAEVLLVGASRQAVDDLARRGAQGRGARVGLHRLTLTQLAARLAAPALSADGLAPCSPLAAHAVAARATFDALGAGQIPYFAAVADAPGFSRTLATTLAELREACLAATAFTGVDAPGEEIARLLAAYEAQLAAARLADRAALLAAATAAVRAAPRDALIGLPLLLLDVPLATRAEAALVAALAAAAPRLLATVPSGDERTRQIWRGLNDGAIRALPSSAAGSLGRLQTYLFTEADPPPGATDDAVRIFSAPGEGREAVEIARAARAEAAAGTPFDGMIVALRAPESYTALLAAAFRRAGVPAYFARGTRRPNPAGRAFLALLSCAAEGLSAARFAEFLSLAQVPRRAPADAAAWTPPRDELLAASALLSDTAPAPAAAAATAAAEAATESAAAGATPWTSGAAPWTSGATPWTSGATPWKWEALLTDAAVIGGAERWARRIDGLARELALRADELAADDPEAPRLAGLGRLGVQLGHLRAFALPVIEQLAAWPNAAPWAAWLDHLRALAAATLHTPDPVLAVLAELAPMAAVGPVGLDEVRDVLADRLTTLTDEPPADRYGRVLVTTLDDLRGRRAAVVFVPGLAERIFPQRPREDPLLLDALRRQLSSGLDTQEDRGRHERLRLRLAVGAATRRLYLSYPRVDVAQGRPRVTSFYGLDVARAIGGGMPDVEAFEREATARVNARLAWPAPPDAADAIDVAEHDLATLRALIDAPAAERPPGGAQYLLELNAHLGRSLRARYMRWERAAWSAHDGLVGAPPEIAPLLARRRLTERAYAPSALERFAVCPYRFFLASVARLDPRPTVGALERLDPLTRGKLIHRVQADTLRALDAAGLLPLAAERHADAEHLLHQALDTVAARSADDLAPPIARVWQDEIAALRGDLLVWLRQLAAHGTDWSPLAVEYGFGLPPDPGRDPTSRRDEVLVDGFRLRGSIDLVERRRDGGALRVVDHKTGADTTSGGLVVGGGSVLQPVLYGVAAEVALGTPVEDGRLVFCTTRGGFGERIVPLDLRARQAGRQVLSTIDAAIAAGHFHPAPADGACARCDYRPVCGPHEAERARRKHPLPALAELRARP